MLARVRRHRRLLALCGLSALAHLGLLAWVARIDAGAPPLPAGAPAADDLVLRLAPADTARRDAPLRQPRENSAAATPPAAAAQARAGATSPAAAARPRADPQPASPTTPPAAASADPGATAAIAALPAATSTPAGQPSPDAPAGAASLIQMPSRYRVRLPEPVLLTYKQTRQAAGGTPQALPDARIDWRSDGERYLLQVDGVLGRLSSQGGSGDAGVRPRSAAEEDGNAARITDFENGEVRFRAGGRSVPDSVGIQDRASLLMQLAGIGLGEPEQLKGTVEVVVAGALEATIERFEPAGIDTLHTALGPIEAWHLAQPAVPGRARLEVWLAPARGWLPVQLRLTGTDGSATTQTVSAMTAQPDAAPAP